MSLIDWIILGSTLFLIVGFGVWKTRGSKNISQFLLGNKEAQWWTIGLSVMATQASAITFLSTPGQAFSDGMGFVQLYFGLPIALVILCITFIPIYYKLKVYTAYEYLEGRFDLKTRSLAAFLFLIQRGTGCWDHYFRPCHHIEYHFRMESQSYQYCDWYFGYHIHRIRRDQGSKCHAQISDAGHICRHVYRFFLTDFLLAGRRIFC